MYVVGHRGAAGVQAENRVAGFQYALNLGCEYVETDVHLSKDGHLVIIHDDTVERTPTAAGVAEMTLAFAGLDGRAGRFRFCRKCWIRRRSCSANSRTVTPDPWCAWCW
jgi:glycerophosphoryl diester phosphodiesterase